MAYQLRQLERDQYPVLVFVHKTRGSLEAEHVIKAPCSLDELMGELMHALDSFTHQNRLDILDEVRNSNQLLRALIRISYIAYWFQEEREAREKMRSEQEKAYQDSLNADRMKAEQKRMEQERLLEEQRHKEQEAAQQEVSVQQIVLSLKGHG